jgi:hypothetical protein
MFTSRVLVAILGPLRTCAVAYGDLYDVFKIQSPREFSLDTNASIVESHLGRYSRWIKSLTTTTEGSDDEEKPPWRALPTMRREDWRLAASQRSNSASIGFVPNTRMR